MSDRFVINRGHLCEGCDRHPTQCRCARGEQSWRAAPRVWLHAHFRANKGHLCPYPPGAVCLCGTRWGPPLRFTNTPVEV